MPLAARAPFERGQAGVGVGAEMDPQDRQVVRTGGAQVAGACASMSWPNVYGLPGIGRSIGWSAVELEEPADRRAALVELAGRVQEARAVAGGGGRLGAVTQQCPEPGEGLVAADVGAMYAWRRA